MDIIIITLLVILIIISIINLISNKKSTDISFNAEFTNNREELNKSINNLSEKLSKEDRENREELTKSINNLNEKLRKEGKEDREELTRSLNLFEEKFSKNIKGKFQDFDDIQTKFNLQNQQIIKDIKKDIETQLEFIRKDNKKQLDEMRLTVDEKLQTTLEKRLGESFKQVSERLEQVHKGLGEMQSVANDVGDLKKVLSNVKTRGTLGEYQLGAILEQMLSPGQYARNVATKKGSQANVEFAVKLPGEKENSEVWIPIDAKYPREDYERLINAFDIGDKKQIELLQKKVIKSLELFAKDINLKYIDPPHTTDFAVMYLPDEGLYAEVLRHPGLFETLQRKYKITITGPTTLSAFLSSLQMGFRTLAVQQRSSEVWDILNSVKSEFATFSDVFATVQKQLNTASGTLEKLRTTRSNILEKKLKQVEIIDNQKLDLL